MPTTNLLPNADGTIDANWTKNTTYFYQAANTDDGDTQSMWTSDALGQAILISESMPGGVATIDGVTTRIKDKKTNTNAPVVRHRIKKGSDATYKDKSTYSVTWTSYQNSDETWTSDWDSNPWTVTTVDLIRLTPDKTTTVANSNWRLTYAPVIVDWTPAAGMSWWLMGQWMPWLAPLFGWYVSMAEIAKACNMVFMPDAERKITTHPTFKRFVPTMESDFRLIYERLKRQPVYGY
jgi:hypothetical protein